MSRNRFPLWTLLLLLPTLQGCVAQRPLEPIPVMDLCQLSRSFKRYDGKLIAVRGIYIGNLLQRCDQKCTTGQPWPSSVWLAEAGPEFPVAFQTDEKSFTELFRMVKDLAKRRPTGVEVWVTVVGRLHAERESPLGPCDRVGGGAYGHLGAWPAELLVKRVDDIAIIAAPDSKLNYGEFLRHGAL